MVWCKRPNFYKGKAIIVLSVLNICVYTLLEDQGVAANDSDSSPPQSRGRGRFEKSRIRGVPRGQSEDARSTSSQGVDETESSSNVGGSLFKFSFTL